MKQYLELAQKILEEGDYKPAARENMPGTYSLFGEQLKYNLSQGFPLVTTKKVSFNNIAVETLWYLKKDDNISFLVDNGCNVWNKDAYRYYTEVCKKYNKEVTLNYEEFIKEVKNISGRTNFNMEYFNNFNIPMKYIPGDLGFQYPSLFRNLPINETLGYSVKYVDQVYELLVGLHNQPFGRRHILNNWYLPTLREMALPPCHTLSQWNVREVEGDKVLDCNLYIRSNDFFLGNPYNTASYALLVHLFSKMLNMFPGNLIISLGDVHIYENHFKSVEEQLTRTSKRLPSLKIENIVGELIGELILQTNYSYEGVDKFFTSLCPTMFRVENYSPHPPIYGKLSVGL